MDRKAVAGLIGKMRADGLSHKAIADRMNADNIPTLSGRGKWQKGTVGKLLKKIPAEPVRKPSPDERIKRLTAAHEGALKEVDRLNAELSKAQTQITRLNTRISRAKKGTGPNMNELQQTVTSAVSEAVRPLYTEIEALKERYETFIRINKPRDQNPVHVLGWNVQKSGKYFKAYRKVNGKVRGIHLGAEYDPAMAEEKIRGAIGRNGEKWGLSQTEINSLIKGNAPEPAPDRLIKSLIRKHAPSSGTAAIWKVRRDFMEATGWNHDEFAGALSELARIADIQLLHGDPNSTPEEELKLNPVDDTAGCHYCSVQWTGEQAA